MEHTNKIIAWEVLAVLVFSAMLFVSAADRVGLHAITGLQVSNSPAAVSQDVLLSDLETAIPQLDFLGDAGDFSSCLIVNMAPRIKYSYEVIKINGAYAVTISNKELCKGTANEDFIISYVSYDKLKQNIDALPSFNELRGDSDGSSFYIYPSKLINPGLTISDQKDFNQRFGKVIRNNLPAAQAERILNPPESAELREAASFTSYIFFIILGVVILVVVLSVFVLKFAKKPEFVEDLELISYIKAAIAQGSDSEQIRESLIANGWDAKKVEEAFTKVSSEVSVPESFT